MCVDSDLILQLPWHDCEGISVASTHFFITVGFLSDNAIFNSDNKHSLSTLSLPPMMTCEFRFPVFLFFFFFFYNFQLMTFTHSLTHSSFSPSSLLFLPCTHPYSQVHIHSFHSLIIHSSIISLAFSDILKPSYPVYYLSFINKTLPPFPHLSLFPRPLFSIRSLPSVYPSYPWSNYTKLGGGIKRRELGSRVCEGDKKC